MACCAPHPPQARAAAITTSFSLVAAAGTTLSAWCVMSRSAIRTRHLLRDLSRFFVDRHLFPSVPQHLGHPNQFADETVRTPHERLVQQATVLGEDLPDLADVDVPEDRDQAQLAHDGQQALNDADPRERTCRHADKSNGFVDVFVEAAIERVLQQSRKTMVVLGRDNHQTVGGAIASENAACFIASPASSTGSGSEAISITPLQTPARRFSSPPGASPRERWRDPCGSCRE